MCSGNQDQLSHYRPQGATNSVAAAATFGPLSLTYKRRLFAGIDDWYVDNNGHKFGKLDFDNVDVCVYKIRSCKLETISSILTNHIIHTYKPYHPYLQTISSILTNHIIHTYKPYHPYLQKSFKRQIFTNHWSLTCLKVITLRI